MADTNPVNNNNDVEEEFNTITLTFENDITVECDVVAVFPVDGKEYMALLPIEEAEGIDPEELLIFRYVPSEDPEDVNLESIEDDDEYEAVADAFDKLLADEDFNELIDDEEQ